jgi:hypothetical protein
MSKKYLRDDFACAEYQQLKLLVFPLLVEHSAATAMRKVVCDNVCATREFAAQTSDAKLKAGARSTKVARGNFPRSGSPRRGTLGKFSSSENASALALSVPRSGNTRLLVSCERNGSRRETKRALEIKGGGSASTAIGSAASAARLLGQGDLISKM